MIAEAAHELGRRFVGRIDHIVGVSWKPRDDNIYIQIDVDEIPKEIPQSYKGHQIIVVRIETPRFAGKD